jgi:hypothetical protein
MIMIMIMIMIIVLYAAIIITSNIFIHILLCVYKEFVNRVVYKASAAAIFNDDLANDEELYHKYDYLFYVYNHFNVVIQLLLRC